MENNGQIAAPARLSARVLDLFGVAFRLAARIELSIDLSEMQARELAVFGNLNTALMRLKDRMTFKRIIPGVGGKESQVRLAVYELAAEAKGGPSAQRGIISQAIEAERAFASDKDRELEKILQAQNVLDEGRATTPALREFIRRADRLRTRQLNKLRATILDSEFLKESIGKLNELHGRFISAAMDV